MEGQETSRWALRNHLEKMKRCRWLRGCIASLLIGTSTCTVGCTAIGNIQENLRYNDSWSNWVVSQRNAAWAARAWHLRKHHFCNEKYLDDFCAGFRAGYLDVASGGNGCTPALPPQEYWGWKYQSAEGQARVAAWFAGFPHGARAAEEDGVGHFSQIQISSTAFNEYHQAGFAGPATPMYPVPENIPANMPGYVPAGAGAIPGAGPSGMPPVIDPAAAAQPEPVGLGNEAPPPNLPIQNIP